MVLALLIEETMRTLPKTALSALVRAAAAKIMADRRLWTGQTR